MLIEPYITVIYMFLVILKLTRILKKKKNYCRSAIDSSLFKQWLHNLQTENGILANDTMTLRQVLIQVIQL